MKRFIETIKVIIAYNHHRIIFYKAFVEYKNGYMEFTTEDFQKIYLMDIKHMKIFSFLLVIQIIEFISIYFLFKFLFSTIITIMITFLVFEILVKYNLTIEYIIFKMLCKNKGIEKIRYSK